MDASVSTIIYTQNDTIPLLYQIVIYDKDVGSYVALDVSDKDVTFSMLNDYTGEYSVLNGICITEDGDTGWVEYDFATNETATPGMYRAKFTVDVDGKKQSFPIEGTQWIRVIPEI